MNHLLPASHGCILRRIASTYAIAFGFSFLAAGDASSVHAEPFKVAAPDGTFEVFFPFKPQARQTIHNVRMQFGRGNLVFYASQRKARQTIYLVGYMNYPGGYLQRLGSEAALGEVRENIRRTHLGHISHESDNKFLGHPSKDFLVTARFNSDPMFLRVRLLLVGNRIYRLIVEDLNRAPSVDIATAFFESFQLPADGR